MRIQHNIAAMNSYRNYNNNAAALNKNLEKLSSGYRINRAGDDAAGLAISEKMRAQIAGLDQAQANVKDGISLVKTAEGALQEVQDMMNRMVTLATQSANGTYQNEVDRENLQKEVTALKKEIDRIADSSNFNGQKLLNGELYAGTTVEIAGAASGSGSTAKSAVDVTLTADAYKKSADGEYDNLTFKLAATNTASKVGAAIDASGAVTITLKQGTAYTAADIKKLIADADTTAIDDLADGDAMKDALNSVTVSGEGVEKITTLAKSSGTPVDGSGTPLTLQIGDTAEDHNQLAVSVKDMHTKALGIDEIDISTLKGAQDAIQTIKDAINMVSSTRGDLGAIQNRLEHTQNNLSVMEENIQDAESTIRDTDIADEMTAYTKNNILLQSAQAMLAQANQMPQGVLQLLQ